MHYTSVPCIHEYDYLITLGDRVYHVRAMSARAAFREFIQRRNLMHMETDADVALRPVDGQSTPIHHFRWTPPLSDGVVTERP